MRLVAGVATLFALSCYKGALRTKDQPAEVAPTRNQAASSVAHVFKIPATWSTSESTLPITYLSKLHVDPHWRLTAKEKQELTRLIAAAHDTSVKQFKQSYYLRTDTPLWRLIRNNWTGSEATLAEGGSVVFLGTLKDFLVTNAPN